MTSESYEIPQIIYKHLGIKHNFNMWLPAWSTCPSVSPPSASETPHPPRPGGGGNTAQCTARTVGGTSRGRSCCTRLSPRGSASGRVGGKPPGGTVGGALGAHGTAVPTPTRRHPWRECPPGRSRKCHVWRCRGHHRTPLPGCYHALFQPCEDLVDQFIHALRQSGIRGSVI